MIIIDETLQEEDTATTRKEGQGKGTDGPILEGRWDIMEKEKDVLSSSD